MKYKCPCCGDPVEKNHFACHRASIAGAAGTGKKKARTSEQARAAVNARWAKVKDEAKKKSTIGKVLDAQFAKKKPTRKKNL